MRAIVYFSPYGKYNLLLAFVVLSYTGNSPSGVDFISRVVSSINVKINLANIAIVKKSRRQYMLW